MKEKPKEQPNRGGSDTLKERGQKGILFGATPELHMKIKAAAALKGMKMNEFCIFAVEFCANQVLENFREKG